MCDLEIDYKLYKMTNTENYDALIKNGKNTEISGELPHVTARPNTAKTSLFSCIHPSSSRLFSFIKK